MADNHPVVWGIHAGRNGEAHSLFMNAPCIAVGWARDGRPFQDQA